MAETPAAGVVRLIDSDAIDPRLERALATKTGDIAEDFKKDLLHYIAGFVLVFKQSQSQDIDGLLEARQQFLVRFLGTSAERLDQTQVLAIRDDLRRPVQAEIQD
jgi:hypothetical protein